MFIPRSLQTILSALLLISTASPAFAADYTASGTSAVSISRDSQGDEKRTVITTSFEVADRYSGDKRQGVLLKKTTKITSATNMEGLTGQLSVEARVDQAKVYDKVAWTLNENADDAKLYEDDLYITSLQGCCDSRSGYRAYNVATGKLVMTYDESTIRATTIAPLTVEVPNTSLVRFLGVTTSGATRDFVERKIGSLARVATVSWASKNGTIQKAHIYTAGDSYGFETSLVVTAGKNKNEINDNRLMLWTADGKTEAAKAFEGFSLQLKDQDEKVILIPVNGDRLNLGQATVPAGYKLSAD